MAPRSVAGDRLRPSEYVSGPRCTDTAFLFSVQTVVPIAIGGSLSIVAGVGILMYRERISAYGYLGIFMGVSGVLLLSTV